MNVVTDRAVALIGNALLLAMLVFAPAVHLIRSHYPIHGIWQFNMVEGAEPPQPGGQNVLITRPEYDPVMNALPAGGGTFVAQAMAGAPFGQAVDTVTAQVPDFDLSTTLGLLLAGGAITRLNED